MPLGPPNGSGMQPQRSSLGYGGDHGGCGASEGRQLAAGEGKHSVRGSQCGRLGCAQVEALQGDLGEAQGGLQALTASEEAVRQALAEAQVSAHPCMHSRTAVSSPSCSRSHRRGSAAMALLRCLGCPGACALSAGGQTAQTSPELSVQP